MFTRREILKTSATAALATSPLVKSLAMTPKGPGGMRCINIVNFIREIEPRFTMDMMLPVTSQMELILKHNLPATWLLQFDALVSGPFVPYLKQHMAKNHEVGFWFEMNEKHVKAAGVNWRGRPGYEWDHLPPVAFTIGYTHDERIKLADTAMTKFKEIWGRYPSSVASWNLDSFTMAHLVDKYKIDAFAVCRDQIATDGFTIWGTPIAGYYPSKTDCWSPAIYPDHQINAPVFRMLGQDPVYYYERSYTLPNGRRIFEPDTMEPAWTSGRSPHFIREFLRMIESEPTLQFGYAQIGQENTFPWDQQKDGYPLQMDALSEMVKRGVVHVETMGDSGRRFKKAFKQTPAQAQIQLVDPFENTNPAHGSIWYQSRFYRANLHIKGDLVYFRDLSVYSDQRSQPFLNEATRLNDVMQRTPSALDGYHWRKDNSGDLPGAGGFLSFGDELVRLTGKPRIAEKGDVLTVTLPVKGGKTLSVQFNERTITIKSSSKVSLRFAWDPAKSMFKEVFGQKAIYKQDDFVYALKVLNATPSQTSDGWSISESNEIKIDLMQ